MNDNVSDIEVLKSQIASLYEVVSDLQAQLAVFSKTHKTLMDAYETSPHNKGVRMELAREERARFEMRSKAVRDGQAKAKALGKSWGGSKKGVWRAVHPVDVYELHREGMKIAHIARSLNVSRSTVYKSIEMVENNYELRRLWWTRRAMIGIEKAKEEGKYKGRASGTTKVSPHIVAVAVVGYGLKQWEASKLFNISRRTVSRYMKDAALDRHLAYKEIQECKKFQQLLNKVQSELKKPGSDVNHEVLQSLRRELEQLETSTTL